MRIETCVIRSLTLVVLSLALVAAPVPFGPHGGPWGVGAAWADDDDDDDGDDDDDDGDDDDDDGGGGASSGGATGGGQSGSQSGSQSGGGQSSGRSDGGGAGGGVAPTRGDGTDPISRWLRRTFGDTEPSASAPRSPRRAAAAPPTSPRPERRPLRPESAPDEIIAFDLAPADLASLIAQGFTDLDTTALAGLGVTLHRLGIAPGLDLATARAQVQALAGVQAADFNHFYRPEQVAHAGRTAPACVGQACPALRQVGWLADGDTCAPVVRVGMIDTAVNTAHEVLAAARIDTLRTADPNSTPADPVHGTAVAALLAGGTDSRLPGLVPDARLTAVDAFHIAGRDTRADAVAVLKGLSHLADSGVDVVNLSLAGPANALMETAVARLAEGGMVLVAAGGNAGPGAPPAYPAAYDPVIAVTAVDGDDRIYRRAQTGTHIDLAAPGVDVWTAASISGLRPMTGTSFAVPFVTAAAARMKATEPTATPADLRAHLAASARDLGDAGHDPVFGHGLLSTAGLCRGIAALWTVGAPDPVSRKKSPAAE